MKPIISSAAKTIGGLILVAFVLIAVIKLLPQSANQVQPGTSDTAYPPPVGTPTPTSTPIPYPPPGKSENPTPTPIVTLFPTIQGIIPRPTEWPTDLPWPPSKITPQPYPTPIPTIFPTPAFRANPAGKMPAVLQKLWYAYSPDSVSSPMVQAEQIDGLAQRWGKATTIVDLGLSPNFPGPSVYAFFPSPDSKWIAADLAYGETTNVYVINSDTGKAIQILPKNIFSAFIIWKPDSQKIIVNDSNDLTSVAEVDIATGAYQHIEFPKLDGDMPFVNTIAYSPDGSLMADALGYQPSNGGRNECLLSIGITDVKSQKRKTIQEITSACGAVYLQWSADGHYLSWIVQRIIPDPNLPHASATQFEMWVSDRVSGVTKSIYQIGVNVSRFISPAWSPDGKKIAFAKFDDKQVRYPDGNIILIDPVNGPQAQVSHFSGLSLSSLQWSSDGKLIFCNAFNAQYGTIWAVNVENGDSFPVAGPVSPESPLAIMP